MFPIFIYPYYEVNDIMTIIDLHTPHTGKYDQPTALFINNEWVEGVKKQTIEVVNPTDESVRTKPTHLN